MAVACIEIYGAVIWFKGWNVCVLMFVESGATIDPHYQNK
jgi:hypothetical protein